MLVHIVADYGPTGDLAFAEVVRGSFRRHFKQMVSRSRGMPGANREGGTGSAETTCINVA